MAIINKNISTISFLHNERKTSSSLGIFLQKFIESLESDFEISSFLIIISSEPNKLINLVIKVIKDGCLVETTCRKILKKWLKHTNYNNTADYEAANNIRSKITTHIFLNVYKPSEFLCSSLSNTILSKAISKQVILFLQTDNAFDNDNIIAFVLQLYLVVAQVVVVNVFDSAILVMLENNTIYKNYELNSDSIKIIKDLATKDFKENKKYLLNFFKNIENSDDTWLTQWIQCHKESQSNAAYSSSTLCEILNTVNKSFGLNPFEELYLLLSTKDFLTVL